MPDRIAIIRNPSAGRRTGPFIDKVARRLRAAGYPVTVLDTEAPGHATDIARKLVEDGTADLIVAAGGDGTIREVATGVNGSDLPVGLIPAGTANVLARELGYLPRGRRSSRHVAHALMSKNTLALHPFEVGFEGSARLGFCWLGAGFDAEVLTRVSPKLKAVTGRLAFVPATFGALLRRGPDVDWQAPDGTKGQCGWLIASNIRRYAGPFILTRQTRVGDRGLACLMLKGRGGLSRMGDQMGLAMGRLDRRADVLALADGSLTVGGDAVPLELDGDFLGYGQATVRPCERAVRFRTGHMPDY